MNYMIILFMVAMTFIFVLLSYLLKNKVLAIAVGFMFLITGVFILGYGIEIPIGTLTQIIR